MEHFFTNILQYLWAVLVATFTQLLILLGPLLLLAFLMNFVSKQNENISYKVMGRNVYLYGFGWLGTAVHELGHAIFAILFGHKITKMVLFSPRAEGGSLGYVNHVYNKKSVIHNIGNFFIGIGPIIFGSFVIFILTYFLFDVRFAHISQVQLSFESLSDVSLFKLTATKIWLSLGDYMAYILTGPTSVWWKVVILVYVLYSVGSSITLSAADVKGATQGFVYFVIVLLIFNTVSLWIGDFATNFFANISRYFSGLYFLIILGMFVNIVFTILLWLIHLVLRLAGRANERH